MPLNKSEYQSAVWKKTKLHMEKRLNVLRKKNDTANNDQLLKNQGAIAELKTMIGLGSSDLKTEDEYEAEYEDEDE